jgi:putative ABC transport system ATP-binding protein
MTTEKKVFIEVKNLQQEFEVGNERTSVLNDMSFEILENSFTIIYGASGSGKSTLLNILSGLQKPTSGSVLFQGQDIYHLDRDKIANFRAKYLGIVYQTNYWVHSLNVIENVSLPLYFLGYSRQKAAKLAMLALERVDMQTFAKKYPFLLSGGEQQRVGLARALVNNPLFIIADEPTGSLDSKTGDMVMSVIDQANQEFQRTVILVTHNMEYLPLANKLLHIQDGTISTLDGKSIQETADELIEATRQRIHHLSEKRHG